MHLFGGMSHEASLTFASENKGVRTIHSTNLETKAH